MITTDTEKLYSPLQFYIHNPREEEASVFGLYDLYDERCKITHEDALEFMDSIELAIRRDRDRMDKTRGMAEYLDGSLGEKVVSLFPDVENYGTIMVCAATVTLSEPLTPDEMAELKSWWRGHLSDGWGEGFEQREIKVGSEELYVVPWHSGDDFFLDTEREFYAQMGLEMPEAKQTAEPLSPAQMALNEPGIFDEDIDCVDTSAYMSMLTDRVNANYIDYIDGLRGKDGDSITDYSAEIATISEAHYYITNRHNFHFSELDYLLKFNDPLRVVAEAFDANRDEQHSGIMWKIFHEQDALKNGRHTFESDTPNESGEPTAEALKQELFDRLDKNLTAFRENMMGASKQYIYNMAEDISTRYAACEYMKTAYDFKTGEVEFLLQFQDPLGYVADRWPSTLDGIANLDSAIAGILEDRSSHGHYELVIDETNPAAKESAKSQPGAEKQSVIERIRAAEKEPKEPRKEKPDHKRDRNEREL